MCRPIRATTGAASATCSAQCQSPQRPNLNLQRARMTHVLGQLCPLVVALVWGSQMSTLHQRHLPVVTDTITYLNAQIRELNRLRGQVRKAELSARRERGSPVEKEQKRQSSRVGRKTFWVARKPPRTITNWHGHSFHFRRDGTGLDRAYRRQRTILRPSCVVWVTDILCLRCNRLRVSGSGTQPKTPHQTSSRLVWKHRGCGGLFISEEF